MRHASLRSDMLFCPFCGTLLILRQVNGYHGYRCVSCAYVDAVRATSVHHVQMTQHNKPIPEGVGVEIDASFAGAGGQKTRLACTAEGCSSSEAYFTQEQIRSADEPPTTFYKCSGCGTVSRSD